VEVENENDTEAIHIMKYTGGLIAVQCLAVTMTTGIGADTRGSIPHFISSIVSFAVSGGIIPSLHPP
jgi:hypothetical protein